MSNFDDFRLAVESLSGGENTVLLDDLGMPSVAGQQHLLVCCTNFALKSLKIQLFKVQTI